MPETRSTCQCLRCGHSWTPRLSDRLPATCAACKTPYWDRPRRASKVAPTETILHVALPADVAAWLKALAADLEAKPEELVIDCLTQKMIQETCQQMQRRALEVVRG